MKLALPLMTLALALPALAHAAPAHALTVGEGFVNPIGFHDATPRFSWKLPADSKGQTAYRIEARLDDGRTWDSGWVNSAQSIFVPYGGPALHSCQRLSWRVKLRTEAGRELGWSETATVELGLLSAADWKAHWIRPAGAMEADTEPVANLRRGFSLSKPVAKARLHVTARGLFSLELNGHPVSKDHFANGFTSYTKRLDTLSYDVSALLHKGDNHLEALLGTGWYAGRLPFSTSHYGPYGRDTALLLQLEVGYADGSSELIVSDEKWESSFGGPILSSSLYDGENYDARRRPTKWEPVLVEKELGGARLAPKPFPSVRETALLPVRRITEPKPGHFIFDLGQNMVGWARLRVPVLKDSTITVHYAEMLRDDGTLYNENYRTAKSTDSYTAASNGTVEWQPHFTFHGFRYVELTGLPPGVKPEPHWVTGVVLHSDLPVTGHFASSHEKLNQLQSNITWGWCGNSVDIPTDCPQRDERMGWTGDAQVFCATSLFNTAAHAFWSSWLQSLRDDQFEDGAIPPFVPDTRAQWDDRSPGWVDAATVIPWDLYVRTGDTRVLSDNYAMMERLVGWYRSQSVEGIPQRIEGFGDWLQPFPKTPPSDKEWGRDLRGDTPRALLGAAFHARSATILSETARVLGRQDDAKRYSEEAASVKAAFAREYFDAAGRFKGSMETQTAYVLAIAFDLLSEEQRQEAGRQLARLVREAGLHLRTGFLGTPFLSQALDQTGHADLAATLLFQESYPSWFFSINQGATTIWERWNSYTRTEGFGDVSMNSFNHYAYGAIGQWMYERVAGLCPDPAAPGYRHFFIRPLPVAQLNSASADLETPYGPARSAWQRNGQELNLDVRVPPNTTATLTFPDHQPDKILTAGSYHFVCKE